MYNYNIRLDDLSKNFKIFQLENHYSISTDTFLLANFANVPKKSSKKIIELCSGTGAIGMLLREKSLAKITLVEIQEQLVELSKKNIDYNLIKNIDIFCQDIKNIKENFPPSSFDYVICNPPYFPIDTMPKINEKNNHSISRHEILCNLEDIISATKYLLKQNGKFSFVHRSYRFPDIVNTCIRYGLAVKRVRFVYSNKNCKNSKIVLVEGSVSMINDLKVEQPLYIYDNNGNYTDEMKRAYNIG